MEAKKVSSNRGAVLCGEGEQQHGSAAEEWQHWVGGCSALKRYGGEAKAAKEKEKTRKKLF